jgi:hypothetical protein
MRTRPGSIVFGIAVGLVVAITSYRWITAPDLRIDRDREVAVVHAARDALGSQLGVPVLETVDPLAPRRSVGKAYIYPADSGWEVSGYYRRGKGDRWHPFLMRLDAALGLIHLKVHDDDPDLARRAANDPRLEVLN